MKSVVTEYTDICIFCGRPAECEHHLIFGTAGRELSEKDGLKVPSCNNCHNVGEKLKRIHENPMAERLSKMLGQAAWEKWYILQKYKEDEETIDWNYGTDDSWDSEKEMLKCNAEAREKFRKRYGKSYL